jgi:hypothetical protein
MGYEILLNTGPVWYASLVEQFFFFALDDGAAPLVELKLF